MDHVSEVAKILEGAIRHDPRQSVSYAMILIDKLERDGARRQANLLRGLVSKAPARAAMGTGTPPLPQAEDSTLSTVDIAFLEEDDEPLRLSPPVLQRLEDFLDAVRHRDALIQHGIDINSRLLIHGPPGTGKTSIARSIARKLRLPLVTTRSDTLVSSLLGQTSRNLREVFDYASTWPCVLFLDEFDALAKNRADAHEVGELQRVVIALLQNMDALGSSTILLASTNHPQLLDPAVWRRFDYTIATQLPASAERRHMWVDQLERLNVSRDQAEFLAAMSEGLSGAAIRTAALDIARSEILAGSDHIRMPQALRRLARLLWYEDTNVFEDPAREAARLRTWAPSVFTLRALAEVFGTSTRQISNYLRDADDESNPPVALRPERAHA